MHGKTHLIRTDRLRAIRKQHQLTQHFVANYLNVSRQCYGQYEEGRRTPDVQALLQLASLYHVRLDYFINMQSADAAPDSSSFNLVYSLGLDKSNYHYLYLNPLEVFLIKKFRCTNYRTQQEIADYICLKAQQAGQPS